MYRMIAALLRQRCGPLNLQIVPAQTTPDTGLSHFAVRNVTLFSGRAMFGRLHPLDLNSKQVPCAVDCADGFGVFRV